MGNSPDNIYSDDYKHFDNLIWQVQIWSLAFFIGIISLVKKEMVYANIILLIGEVLILIFSYILYRYRIHQYLVRPSKIDHKVHPPKLFGLELGGQVCLQFSISLQFAVILYIILRGRIIYDTISSFCNKIVFLLFVGGISIVISSIYEKRYYKKTSKLFVNIKFARFQVKWIKKLVLSVKTNISKFAKLRFIRKLEIIAMILGALTTVIYLFAYKMSDTKINFQILGQKSGNIIRIPHNSEMFIFVINTECIKKEVQVKKVYVEYNPADGIRLLPDNIGGTSYLELSSDNEYPASLEYDLKKDIQINSNNCVEFGFIYVLPRKVRNFKLKFIVITKIPEWEYSFPLSMFPPQEKRTVKIYEFSPIGYDVNNIDEYVRECGIKVGPRKAIKSFGVVAQEGARLTPEKGAKSMKVNFYELILDDKESQKQKSNESESNGVSP